MQRHPLRPGWHLHAPPSWKREDGVGMISCWDISLYRAVPCCGYFILQEYVLCCVKFSHHLDYMVGFYLGSPVALLACLFESILLGNISRSQLTR